MKKPLLKVSIIIIVSGRKTHLLNTLEGIENSTSVPSEVIIVSMNEKLKLAPRIRYSFDVVTISLILPSYRLPLAKARNTGARNARENTLVFLDVDCIPAPNFLDTIVTCSSKFMNDNLKQTGLVMGTPRYLNYIAKNEQREGIAKDMDFLIENSQLHPHRPKVEVCCQTFEQYELFWSLCFSISKARFEEIGGFDESFIGYGGEDTDFAFVAKEKKIPFFLSSATVFHQQHEVSSPPLGHFKDIITNANVFYKKWKRWAMEAWLEEFRKLDLIEWNEESPKPIIVKKYPSKELLENCLQKKAAFA